MQVSNPHALIILEIMKQPRQSNSVGLTTLQLVQQMGHDSISKCVHVESLVHHSKWLHSSSQQNDSSWLLEQHDHAPEMTTPLSSPILINFRHLQFEKTKLFASLSQLYGWCFFRYDHCGNNWYCLTCSSSSRCCHFKKCPDIDHSEPSSSSGVDQSSEVEVKLEDQIKSITDEFGMLKVTSHSQKQFSSYSSQQKLILQDRLKWISDKLLLKSIPSDVATYICRSNSDTDQHRPLFQLRPSQLGCSCEPHSSSDQSANVMIENTHACTLLCPTVFVDIECVSLKCLRCLQLTQYVFIDFVISSNYNVDCSIDWTILCLWSSSYDGADDCILNIDSRHMIDHRVFLDKQQLMFNSLKFFPFSSFVDKVIQEYSATFDLCGIRRQVDDALDRRLSVLRHWKWSDAYRNFELLQRLPYDLVSSCDCDGVCGDGTAQAIRLKQLCISPLPRQTEQLGSMKHISFQKHTFLKQHLNRTNAISYVTVTSSKFKLMFASIPIMVDCGWLVIFDQTGESRNVCSTLWNVPSELKIWTKWKTSDWLDRARPPSHKHC